MRIIRPMDLTGAGVATSNAPTEQLDQWLPLDNVFFGDGTPVASGTREAHGVLTYDSQQQIPNSLYTVYRSGGDGPRIVKFYDITDTPVEGSTPRCGVDNHGSQRYVVFCAGTNPATASPATSFFVLDAASGTVLYIGGDHGTAFGGVVDTQDRVMVACQHVEPLTGQRGDALTVRFSVMAQKVSGGVVVNYEDLSRPLSQTVTSGATTINPSIVLLKAFWGGADGRMLLMAYYTRVADDQQPESVSNTELAIVMLDVDTDTASWTQVADLTGSISPSSIAPLPAVSAYDESNNTTWFGGSGQEINGWDCSSNTLVTGYFAAPSGSADTVFNLHQTDDGRLVTLLYSSSTTPSQVVIYDTSDGSELAAYNIGVGYLFSALYLDAYLIVSSDAGGEWVDLSDGSEGQGIIPPSQGGRRVIFSEKIYEALTDNNDRPDLGTLEDPPTWLDLGYINPLRMFDGALDSRTTAPSPLVIEIETGRLTNGLALFNLAASSVQITYTDPVDGVVYDSGEISLLDNSPVRTWYDFFFEPYSRRSDFARLDLPAYTDGTITITLTNNEGDVEVGEIVVGSIYRIGEAQFGSSAGILDFSRKEQDQFGRFDIVKRRFSKRAEYDAVIDPATGGNIQRTLAQYRAAPVVWVGDESKEETIVYGFFREFDILLDNPAFTAVTITVEGL